ncbi:GGDEF domain-containing protein [Thalassotalea agarivorans]|uniref:diguanylate cyclase n=1 Tax=Thalassotalea agarivorans TaxID=349064 RepID=A0A1I0CP80_THASX|nr:diguanylate cyclase [Thalassotalea agarivorans]SET21458.1 diguanylate cyclase [Thalassotalea agarivorans]
MKYHDSASEAEKKLRQSLAQLKTWSLPPNPINYSVCYEYVSLHNADLIAAINQHIDAKKTIDSFFIEEVYREHLLGHNKVKHALLSDLDDLLRSVQETSVTTSKTIDGFVNKIDGNLAKLDSDDINDVIEAVAQLKQSTRAIKTEQLKLRQHLLKSRREANSLREDISKAKQEALLDPLTKFYNRKALVNQIDHWQGKNPNLSLAAIVVNIDDFAQFSQRFGPLISDVLLAKVAQKISTYVDDSGVPIRSGGDEFLILLPEVEKTVADVIAQKISLGVSKLKFVSSKSGLSLPRVNVSVGVSQYSVRESAEYMIKTSRAILQSNHLGGGSYALSS